MKPQDSKNAFPDVSQTQVNVGASDSQAIPSASSEQTAGTSEKKLPISQEKLKNIIAGLERDLADGSWLKNSDSPVYEDIDFELMPALVDQANHKHKELNLQFFTEPKDFASTMREAIAHGVKASRSIIGLNCGMVHFAVIDQRTIDGKTSLLLFESTQFDNMIAYMVATKTHVAIQACQLSDCHFAMAEMGIQRSASECGMFSLALAKKLHTDSEQLTRMHQDNISGVLCKPDEIIPHDKVDCYLPARFYKHIQGRRRLEKYIKSNPEAAKQTVNKKGDTLVKRFDKSLVETEGRSVSISAHRKRIREYKSLLL